MPADERPPAITPQVASNDYAVISSVEWLYEPCWNGDRLIARIAPGSVQLTDREGEQVELHELTSVLPAAVDASVAVLDGVWTAQPFIGVGSAAAHLAEAIEEEGLADDVPDPRTTERARAFIAIDLLQLDDEPLHDVPYLERRRLLESVVTETSQVRVTPSVTRPVEHWVAAWRTAGFTHHVAKHQNGRYRPGERTDDWIRISNEAEAPPTIFSRLFGARPRKVRHITDRPRRR